MKLPNILPPADLLEQFEGIERGLRQRRRLGVIGLVGLIISSLASALPVINQALSSDWWQTWARLLQGQWGDITWQQVVPLLVVSILVISLALVTWSRFWLSESRRSFRYTYSIDDFKPVMDVVDSSMAWLRHDLSVRLSKRIGRLALLDEAYVKAEAERDKATAGERGTADPDGIPESHVHISGYYVIRKKPDNRWVLEVMPRVRIGPPGKPETLAHTVEFSLSEPTADPQKALAAPPPLGSEEYEQVLLERVYFSVATQIYRQIRQDVQRKIDLLPTGRFRATAYFHEAEDYARSNTLDAYDEAAKLYYKAMEHYDPRWRTMPESRLRHLGHLVLCWMAGRQRWLRIRAATVWPRRAQGELLAAQSEVGYANMLLYRNYLARLSGSRIKPISEARTVAERAFDRLSRLSRDMPGQREVLFDTYVTQALAWCYLVDAGQAEQRLQKARELAPSRAEQDAHYLFAAGEVEANLLLMIPLYRRAVEADPAFEVAQYQLALTGEMLWRTRHTFERSVAELILAEYQKVLKLNPGNISAWAARGYIYWLLADPQHDTSDDLHAARRAFEYGRQYKEIKSETFVAELDYGLARIAAEEGDFKTAYEHQLSAVSARVAQGVSYIPVGDGDSWFSFIGDAMIRRYLLYKETVEQHLLGLDRDDSEKRVRDNVYAFVLNDYGEAYFNYYLRALDEAYLSRAIEQFKQSIEKNHIDYVMPIYNLARCSQAKANLSMSERWKNLEAALKRIQRVNEMEPTWPDGNLALADIYVLWVLEARGQVEKLRAKAEEARAAAEQARAAAEQARAAAEQARAETRAPAGSVSRLLPETPMAGRSGVASPETGQGYQKAQSVPERKTEQHEQQARQHEQQIGQHEQQIGQHEQEAHDLEECIHETEKRVHNKLRELLPHEWLWCATPSNRRQRLVAATRKLIRDLPLNHRRASDAGTAADARRIAPSWQKWQQQLDTLYPKSLVTNTRFESRLKWQRELEAIHIQALSAWIRLVWLQQETLEDQDGMQARLCKIIQITRHLWNDFLPSNFDLLYDIRTNLDKRDQSHPNRRIIDTYLDNDERTQITRQLVNTIKRWFDMDPVHGLVLTWIDAEYRYGDNKTLFGDKYDPRRIFAEAFCKPDLPAALYHWLSDRLWSQSAPDPEQSEYQEWIEAAQKRGDPASLFRIAQELEKRRNWSDSVLAYRAAMQCDADRNPPLNPPEEYHYAIGCVRWVQGDYPNALAEFTVLGSLMSSQDQRWRWLLVQRLQDFIRSRDDYYQMKTWLEEQRRRMAGASDPAGLHDAQQAILLLVRTKYLGIVRGTPATESASQQAPPIVIFADAGLFPTNWNWQEDPLFTRYLPDMRARIYAAMGVPSPEVLIRATADRQLPGGYLLTLRDIPLSYEQLPLDKNERFCPEAAACRALGIEGRSTTNPCDETEGLWLDQAAWKRAQQVGLPVWERYQFMIFHLEAWLRRHLASFMDIQATQNLLDAWAGDSAERRALHARALPDDTACIRLVQVLQSLLNESVPIKNLDAILTTFADSDVDDVELRPVVERVRMALRADLPGNTVDRRLIALAPGFEDAISRQIMKQYGRRFLALAAEEEQCLIDAMRRQLTGREASDLALVVQNPDLRPFVSRLVAGHFPALPVLAASELIGGLAPGDQA